MLSTWMIEHLQNVFSFLFLSSFLLLSLFYFPSWIKVHVQIVGSVLHSQNEQVITLLLLLFCFAPHRLTHMCMFNCINKDGRSRQGKTSNRSLNIGPLATGWKLKVIDKLPMLLTWMTMRLQNVLFFRFFSCVDNNACANCWKCSSLAKWASDWQ